ncbi:hypothetical protein QN366_04955 [Pseudomonas sp. CCC3.2]|nr:MULTISPECIES: hypothetical protein [unclassified Pseudomonas]MDY7559937.1 hypothetical protein [Pseudomonas sp. AB6]MEB0179423.1 hypothetical protein [Pseudomonas sp. CCC3.2]MEB0210489.1 hypothetical protein [Pseudomonas sp. AB6]
MNNKALKRFAKTCWLLNVVVAAFIFPVGACVLLARVIFGGGQ